MSEKVVSSLRFHCVFRIDNFFFLVAENERTEVITIFRISETEFNFLRRIGVPLCNVVTPPTEA